jgi:hypothetical protein
MDTLTYELIVCVVAYGIFRLYQLTGKRLRLTTPASFAISNVQGAFLILAALGGIAVLAVLAIRASDQVKICKQNEQTIASALTAYETAVEAPYPAGTVTVKIHAGTTPGTFSNPNAAGIDYLGSQPIDEVNPTGLYSMTVVAATTTTDETYTIVCPGVHSQADLASLTGSSSATKGEVQLSDGTFSAI